MLDLTRMAMILPDLIAGLEALQERVRDREAAQTPEVLDEAASAVRTLIGALGTSQGGLARELAMSNDKTVRDWCSARVAPAPPAVRAMRLLAERLIPQPPPELVMGADRVGPCAAALAAHLDALSERAEAAGWQPDEIAAAVAAWATSRSHRP